jgi:hypothetical protein
MRCDVLLLMNELRHRRGGKAVVTVDEEEVEEASAPIRQVTSYHIQQELVNIPLKTI